MRKKQMFGRKLWNVPELSFSTTTISEFQKWEKDLSNLKENFFTWHGDYYWSINAVTQHTVKNSYHTLTKGSI